MVYQDIIDFWFKEIDSSLWWKKESEFDREIRERFLDIHSAAASCELFSWRMDPFGRLAEIVILDQFSRNMFRDAPLSFAFDRLALVLAQEAVAAEADVLLPPSQRSFLYMPYMHSESVLIHEKAVELFSSPELEGNLDFELKHKSIIDRFGRFPHRNKILGRQSTKEEEAFMLGPDSSF